MLPLARKTMRRKQHFLVFMPWRRHSRESTHTFSLRILETPDHVLHRCQICRRVSKKHKHGELTTTFFRQSRRSADMGGWWRIFFKRLEGRTSYIKKLLHGILVPRGRRGEHGVFPSSIFNDTSRTDTGMKVKLLRFIEEGSGQQTYCGRLSLF